MNMCGSCLYYHPERERRKCSALPRARVEEIEKCVMHTEPPAGALAMRALSREDIERLERQEEERRELKKWQEEIMNTPPEKRKLEI